MKVAEVWVPLRISGFFQMMDPTSKNDIPNMKIGSRGGGPSLSAFGKTKIICKNRKFGFTTKKKNKISYEIWINNVKATSSAYTSISVLNQMIPYIKQHCFLKIFHNFDLPLGSGYGTSGAGALGIAFCLKKIFNIPLSDQEIAKFAHVAEVVNHTGLGTVGGQFSGGLSITLEPGYPFQMKYISFPEDTIIVVGSFGAISTKDILTNIDYRILIHLEGKKAMDEILSELSVQNYIMTCKNFLINTQIVQKLKLNKISELLSSLNDLPIFGASMNMLGKSVFCFCKKSQEKEVLNVFNKFSPYLCLKVLKIFESGPFYI